DTASYLSNLSGVNVSLATGLASGGDASGDRLISIENVWGSNFADQVVGNDGANILIGFDGNDTLQGGAGADTLMGGAGADIIDGGAGIDVASYYSSSAGVSVNLASGLMQGGDAQGDVLTGIEQVIGSGWADTITGDASDNVLSGEGGDDVINGGDGNDTLFGGEGSDTLFGGEGGDLIYGGTGADVINGGNGLNTVVYLDSTQGVAVNLASGQGHGGDAEGDTLSSIAGVNGSMFADTLTGSSGSDWLWGFDGNDTLTGGAGSDSLSGGNGSDVAVFSGSATAATITKAGDSWTVNSGADGIDTVTSIEELRFTDRSVWLDGRNNTVVATNDRVTTTKGQSITLALSTLLANDRDFDGDIMHVTAVQATQGGSVVLDGLGNVIFTPAAGFSGMAGFSYTVDDGRGGVATASVEVVVQGGTNVAPVATNSMAFVQTPGIISGKLTAQDADNARSDLSFSMATGAAHGTVVVNPNGTFTYTANTGYSGEDSFTYRVADPSGLDSTARVDVRVSALAGYNQISRVNQYSSNQQQLPSIAGFSNGDYVVTWTSLYQDGSNYGVYARRYDAGGNPLADEFLLNQTTDLDQANSSVTVLADGSFLVAWNSNHISANSWDIYARHFNRDGSPQSGEFRVNTNVINEQSTPAVSKLADGGFVVTWQSDGQDGSSYGVYGQRYNALGVSQGAEFRLNQFTSSIQGDSQVIGLKNGGFVAVWASDSQDSSYYGVYGRIYDANGMPIGSEFCINERTQYSQWQPAVAATDDGGFAVAWQDNYAMYGLGFDISARHFTANGTPTGVTRYPNLTA
ncbi:MAG: calcium-binding protein, partial [Rhodospirillales bacterium]